MKKLSDFTKDMSPGFADEIKSLVSDDLSCNCLEWVELAQVIFLKKSERDIVSQDFTALEQLLAAMKEAAIEEIEKIKSYKLNQ